MRTTSIGPAEGAHFGGCIGTDYAANAESDADLWADRHEPDVGSQLLEQESAALVATVVADLLTQ